MKKISLCFIALLMFLLPVTRSYAAAPVAVAAGGIEVGALAFWGGAVLVAAAGTAVGLDQELMNDIEAFGRDVWNTADEAVRASITASVKGMEKAWNTASTHAVAWTGEAKAFIEQKWNEWFPSVRVEDGKVVKVASSTAVMLPSTVTAERGKNLGRYGGEANDKWVSILNVEVNSKGLATYKWEYNNFQNSGTDKMVGEYPNALAALAALAAELNLKEGYNTVPGEFEYDGKPFEAVIYPNSFPTTVTLPAPRGWLDADGKVTGYEKPTIGRIGGTLAGDIAVGFPTIPGALDQLGEKDSIKAPPIAPEIPGTVDPPIDGTQVAKDVSSIKTDVGTLTETLTNTSTESINWEPLKVAGMDFTRKFPFSIPWDVARQLSVFDVSPKTPVWSFDKTFYFNDYPIRMNFDLDFSMFDGLAVVVRWILLIMFDIGLALGIRKLMPE